VPLRHRPHRVILVPLDDRPCSVKMPRLLARMVDYELVMPSLEVLGQFGTPGQPDHIAAWLLEQLGEPADCAILSLDMLAYGGLTASCTSGTRTQLALERLDILARIRAAAPSMPIFASSSIMRLSTTTSSDDTAQYWEALRRYAVTAGRAAETNDDPQLAAELERLERGLPAAILGEYSAIRARNHEVNLRAIHEVADGNIDFLLLGQDEGGRHGLHIGEQTALVADLDRLGLRERTLICSGIDEATELLLARFIHKHMEKVPLIRVIYSNPDDADMIPAEENRPFAEAVGALVEAVGAKLTSDRETADLTLVVNTPAPQPRAAYKAPGARRERSRELADFIDQIDMSGTGRGLAICDAAFPMGADDIFAETLLSSGITIPRLLSFAASGTASSALAKCLAHSSLRLIALQDKGAFDLAHAIGELSPMRYLALLNSLIDAEKAHIEFLFQCFIKDWLFQTRVRPRATAHVARLVRAAQFDLTACARYAEDIVHDRIAHAAADLWIESFLGRDCAEIGPDEYRSRLTLAELEETRARLPWRRLAEVDVDLEFGVQLDAEA